MKTTLILVLFIFSNISIAQLRTNTLDETVKDTVIDSDTPISTARSSRTVALNKLSNITRLYADKASNKHSMKINSGNSMECTSFKNDDPVLSVRMYRDMTVCSPTGTFSICSGSECPTLP